MTPVLRPLWAAIGGVALAAGLIGVVVPLLPTTPFLLLAVIAFGRSSPRLERWLADHPRLGPPIRNWQAHGVIAPGAKRAAVIAIAAAFGLSVALGLAPRLLLIQGIVLACVLAFILTRPSYPRG